MPGNKNGRSDMFDPSVDPIRDRIVAVCLKRMKGSHEYTFTLIQACRMAGVHHTEAASVKAVLRIMGCKTATPPGYPTWWTWTRPGRGS